MPAAPPHACVASAACCDSGAMPVPCVVRACRVCTASAPRGCYTQCYTECNFAVWRRGLQKASLHRCADGDRAQSRHIARRVALVVLAVVAEPPGVAVAPALDAATDEDRACVVAAGRDGDGAGVEVDGAQGCHLALRAALAVLAVVAELPVLVATPALDAATDEDRAGVVVAGRDGDGAGVEVDGAQSRHIALCVALVVIAVVAELPAATVAPALDVATEEDRAVVGPAGRDGDGAGVEVDGAQGCAISPSEPPLLSLLS
eukprot:scaffold114803_cov69-Phaeocystis_antarctica.AAC.1